MIKRMNGYVIRNAALCDDGFFTLLIDRGETLYIDGEEEYINLHRWVTARAKNLDDTEWFWGNYFSDLLEAESDFRKRSA